MTAFDIVGSEDIDSIIRAVGRPQNDAERMLVGSIKHGVTKLGSMRELMNDTRVAADFMLTQLYKERCDALIHEIRAYAYAILTYRENSQEYTP